LFARNRGGGAKGLERGSVNECWRFVIPRERQGLEEQKREKIIINKTDRDEETKCGGGGAGQGFTFLQRGDGTGKKTRAFL